jgi:hypothetical protein
MKKGKTSTVSAKNVKMADFLKPRRDAPKPAPNSASAPR